MDKLSLEQIENLQNIICEAAMLDIDVKITQDTDKEILIIEDLSYNRVTVMNCAWNSVAATVGQVCSHLNKGTLFSSDKDYIIGTTKMSEFPMIDVYIAVMDYKLCKIKMYTVQMAPDYQTEDVEDWLNNNTDYSAGSCYFMCSSNEIEVEYV